VRFERFFEHDQFLAVRRSKFRAVYMVSLGEKVYVLHAFQKKSKSGTTTPKSEIALIKDRMKRAVELHKEQEN
jgi:phage-related protein